LVPALNRGLQACRGEFIARLDADDEMRPSRLAAQVLALREQAGWGLVSCRVEFGGDARAQAGYADHVRWLNEQIQPAQLRLARFVESPMAHPSVMWRRAISDAHGAYRDGDFPEDYELWLRWFEAGVEMGKVAAALLVWHDSPGRLSRVDSRYRPEAFFRLKAAFMARELVRTAGGRAVWIAGAGRPTRRRAAELETHGVTIAGYLDVDPRKIGQRIEGRPVVGPGELPDQAAAVVLSYVGNRGARDKVRRLLAAQGRAEGRDFWLCA
jgi:glycosyltransferase involved in cell wall biosynthesis